MPSHERPLEGSTIVAVFAHPDDESLACGGTLARAAHAGARVVVVCATRGESGSSCDPALVPDGDLGRARVEELTGAARELGIAEVVIMDHPDGDIRWRRGSQLDVEIALTLQRCRADAVITFDEDGLYWHPDHIGVHERTTEAIRSFGADAPTLYYVTIPRGVMQAIVDAASISVKAPRDLTFWGIAPDAFGYAANPSTLVVDVRDWVPQKMAALRCHRTQVGPQNPLAWIDDDSARRILGAEHFRRAPIDGRREYLLEKLATTCM